MSGISTKARKMYLKSYKSFFFIYLHLCLHFRIVTTIIIQNTNYFSLRSNHHASGSNRRSLAQESAIATALPQSWLQNFKRDDIGERKPQNNQFLFRFLSSAPRATCFSTCERQVSTTAVCT